MSDEKIPTIVVEMQGGIIHCVRSDMPVRVITLDADIQGGDPENIKEVAGEEVYVTDYQLLYEVESGYPGVDREGVEGILTAIEPDAEEAGHEAPGRKPF